MTDSPPIHQDPIRSQQFARTTQRQICARRTSSFQTRGATFNDAGPITPRVSRYSSRIVDEPDPAADPQFMQVVFS